VLGEPNGTLESWDGSFNWTGVSGATYYYLEVKRNGGVILSKWYAASSVCTGMTCSVAPSELSSLPNASYSWRIQDYGGYGYGNYTDYQDFTLNR
jgi:hypothetical protein